MSIALSAKVESLERRIADLEQSLAAALEWIDAMRESGAEPHISGAGLPNANRRKPGPKPKDGANG